MKKLLIAATALSGVLVCVNSAMAADPVIDPGFDWTGFYLGVQGGYDWGSSKRVPWGAPNTGVLVNNDGPAKMNGWEGGIHAGYDYQINQIVLGVVGDVAASNLQGDDDGRGGHVNGFDAKWQGSLRARAGLAFDTSLLYLTGGWAHLAGDGTVQFVLGGPFVEKRSTSFDGWTIGAGFEHAFTPNLSANIEYRYTDYGQTVETYTSGYDLGFKPQINSILLGISYRF